LVNWDARGVFMKKMNKDQRGFISAITTIVMILSQILCFPMCSFADIRPDNIAVQSLFNAFDKDGIENPGKLALEAFAGVRLLMNGKNPTLVNGILTETCERVPSGQEKRRIEFLNDGFYADKETGSITAYFRVLDKENTFYRVEYSVAERSEEQLGGDVKAIVGSDIHKKIYEEVFAKGDFLAFVKVDRGDIPADDNSKNMYKIDRIGEVVGSGSTAEVFKATMKMPDGGEKDVALKVYTAMADYYLPGESAATVFANETYWLDTMAVFRDLAPKYYKNAKIPAEVLSTIGENSKSGEMGKSLRLNKNYFMVMELIPDSYELGSLPPEIADELITTAMLERIDKIVRTLSDNGITISDIQCLLVTKDHKEEGRNKGDLVLFDVQDAKNTKDVAGAYKDMMGKLAGKMVLSKVRAAEKLGDMYGESDPARTMKRYESAREVLLTGLPYIGDRYMSIVRTAFMEMAIDAAGIALGMGRNEDAVRWAHLASDIFTGSGAYERYRGENVADKAEAIIEKAGGKTGEIGAGISADIFTVSADDHFNQLTSSENKFLEKEQDDERYIAEHASKYLKGKPVNLYPDLSLVQRKGLTDQQIESQLRDNMNTMAYMMALHNRYGLDVRYILEDTEDTVFCEKAKTVLEECIRDIAFKMRVDADGLIGRINNPHTGEGVMNLYLGNARAMDRFSDMKEDTYVVAMSGDVSGVGYIPSYGAAANIGFAMITLKFAGLEKDPGYDKTKKTIFGRVLNIYQKLGANIQGLNEEVFDLMVNGRPGTRFYYSKLYALPPVLKMSIQRIHNAYEKLQAIMQFA